jgi:DNA transposition AAA+ family ATPase
MQVLRSEWDDIQWREKDALRQERFRFGKTIDWIESLRDAGISLDTIVVRSGVPKNKLTHALLCREADADVIAALSAWKNETDKAASRGEDVVMTPTLRKIINAFDDARNPVNEHGGKGIALVFGASGTGKTEAAKWYAKESCEGSGKHSSDYWPVVLVRCTGDEKSFGAVLADIVATLISAGMPKYIASGEKAKDVICNYIPKGGLIIFDEAHLMPVKRMDELRYFPDTQGIALAFIGNLTCHQKLLDAKITQLTSRAIGTHILIGLPKEEDIDALLCHWELHGKGIQETAYQIGLQEGGLRALSHTVEAARKMAAAVNASIDSELFKMAALQCGTIQP